MLEKYSMSPILGVPFHQSTYIYIYTNTKTVYSFGNKESTPRSLYFLDLREHKKTILNLNGTQFSAAIRR